MTVKPEPQDAIPAAAPSGSAVAATAEQRSVGRRRALRTVLTGAVAAVGAAVLVGRHPDPASAVDNPTTFTTSGADASPAVEADSTSTAAPAALKATNTQAFPAIIASNSSVGDGIDASSLTGNGATGTGSTGILGQGSSVGVYGQATTTGGLALWGQSTGTAATVEADQFSTGPAVYGTNTGGGYGVWGSAGGAQPGVYGSNSGTGGGVLGSTTSATSAAVEGDGNTLGIQGVITAGAATGYGVKGFINTGSSGSAGVLGYAPTSGYGFYGFSGDPAGAGCLAYNTTTSGYGLQAFNAGAGTGYAAAFGSAAPHSGNVLVRGVLTQLGGAPTTGARDASGALHRLYGVISPDSWAEDFGSAQLSNGSATVQLDPAFAGLVDTSEYHVFLTPRGDASLYVSSQTPGGFTVSQVGSGSAAAGGKPGAGAGGGGGIGFSYRVVAKPSAAAGARLEAIPEPPETTAPAIAGTTSHAAQVAPPAAPPTPPVPHIPGH